MDCYRIPIVLPKAYNFRQVPSISRVILQIFWNTCAIFWLIDLITIPLQVIFNIFSLNLWIVLCIITILGVSFLQFLPVGVNYNLLVLEDKLVYWDPKTCTCKNISRNFVMFKCIAYVILYDGKNYLFLHRCANLIRFLENVAPYARLN